jgi:AcrR family transcriptional regulator
MSSSQRADARRNRAALIEAAGALLAERGLAVQVEDVANAAGVGVATIYRHFGNRDGLIREVLAGRTVALVAVVRDAIQGLAPSEAIERVVHTVAVVLAAERGLVDIAMQFRAQGDETDPSFLEMVALLERVLRDAQLGGAVRADVTVEELNVLLIAAGMATLDSMARARVCEVIVDGLRPR